MAFLQEVDMQHDDAMPHKNQATNSLPSVPVPPQERQHLMGQLPTDIAPAFQAAADTLHNTAEAQVSRVAVPCNLFLIMYLQNERCLSADWYGLGLVGVAV